MVRVHFDELEVFAAELADRLKPGDCVCLTGEMGAGKTTLSFFLVKALCGQSDLAFSSPTFTILNQYLGAKAFVNHMDLYRLDEFADFEDLDLVAEMEREDVITLVEWGEKFLELDAHYTHKIHLDFDPREAEVRQIQITDV